MKPIFPFAAPEWRHMCGTEIEGGWVSKGRRGREEKGDIQLVAILYFVLAF
jgi:hypothetical protein